MATQTASPKLLSPFKLGDLSLKNRVVMPPMTRGRAVNNSIPNDLMTEYYAQRTGSGLIITEGTFISNQADGWVNAPGIYTEAQSEGWKNIVNLSAKESHTVFLQSVLGGIGTILCYNTITHLLKSRCLKPKL